MNGLAVDYYNICPDHLTDVSGRTPTLSRYEGTIDKYGDSTGFIDHPDGIDREYFKAIFHGKIIPETTETYGFNVSVDDYARLEINGVEIFDWVSGGGSGSIALSAGVPVTIKLEFWNGPGSANVHLYWSYDIYSSVVIPPENLIADVIFTLDPVVADSPDWYLKLEEDYTSGDPAGNFYLYDYRGDRHGWLADESDNKSYYEFSAIQNPQSEIAFQQLGARSWTGSSIATKIPGKTLQKIIFPPTISSSPEWTLEFWIYLNESVRNFPAFSIQGNNALIAYIIDAVDGDKLIYADHNHSDSQIVTSGESIFEANRFIHVAIVFADNSIKIYWNGYVALELAANHTGAALAQFIGIPHRLMGTGRPVIFEGNTLTPVYSTGLVVAYDSIAFWLRPLSDAEILRHYLGSDPISSDLSPNDSLLIIDSVKINVVYDRSLSDTLNIGDFRGVKRDLIDVVGVYDYFDPNSIINFRPNDSVFLIDAVNVMNVQQHSVYLQDIIIFEDYISGAPSTDVTDILTLTDYVDTPGLKFMAFIDTLHLTETLSVETPGVQNISLTDTLYLYDVGGFLGVSQRLTDALFLTDASGITGVPFVRMNRETLVLTDTIRTNLFVIDIRDLLILNETVHKNLSKFDLLDPLVITEKLHYSPMKIAIIDNLEVNDEVILQENHQYIVDNLELVDDINAHFGILNISLTDTLNISDSEREIPSPIRLKDTLFLTDLVGQAREFSFVDTLVLVDFVIRLFENELTDTLVLTDIAVATGGKNIIDILNLIDGVCVCFKPNPRLLDTLVLRDYTSVLLNGATPAPPPVSVGDGITIHTVFNRRLTDRLFLVDTVHVPMPIKPCCLD